MERCLVISILLTCFVEHNSDVFDEYKVESTTVINSYLKNYGKAISKAFKPRECVFTNAGYDYRGVMRRTTDDDPCRSWSVGQVPGMAVHSNPGLMHRLGMIDGHVGARGYCRVTLNSRLPPSCIPFVSKKAKPCTGKPLPFCPQFKGEHCRHTGNGQEYMGSQSRSRSGQTCLSWKEAYGRIKRMLGEKIKQFPFKSTMNKLHEHFPELRAYMYAKKVDESVWWRYIDHNYCRNWYPWAHNGRDQGPYCFVESVAEENGEWRSVIVPETCDVPFCDARPTTNTYITRGSNSPMDTYVKMPDQGALLLDIRSWTVEYAVHTRIKFVDTGAWNQRGYYVRIGPTDTIVSKIRPFVKLGEFRKWKQFSSNRTMAVEWRRVYFDFDTKSRMLEIGDILDDGSKEAILFHRDMDFVKPKLFSAVSSIEGATFCPRIPIKEMLEFQSLLEWLFVSDIFYDWTNLQRPNKGFDGFVAASEIPADVEVVPNLFVGYQHPYKDCNHNYQRSRLMVHIPHLEDKCEEYIATGQPTFMHTMGRIEGSPDDNPVYEISFTLRSNCVSPLLYLLDQPGAFPRWFQDMNFKIDYDFYMRWYPRRADFIKKKDRKKYLRVADYVVPNSGFLVYFNVTEKGQTMVHISPVKTRVATARRDGRLAVKAQMLNTSFFNVYQEYIRMDVETSFRKSKSINRKHCPTFLESKSYVIRGDREKFQFFHVWKKGKRHELISWTYKKLSLISKAKMNKGQSEIKFAHKLLKNADPIINYVSFGNLFTYIYAGRHVFYTVNCLPKNYDRTPKYPDCALTRDDPKFAGHWRFTNVGFECTRWDDPLVQKYEPQLFKRIMKGWHIDEEWFKIDKNSFDAYQRLMKEQYTFSQDIMGAFRRLTYDQFMNAQQSAGDPNNYPDNSITGSDNSCRTLGSSELGPFCYTYSPFLGAYQPFLWPIPMPCELPLCNFDRCRATLTGHEYHEESEHTATDALFRGCLVWTHDSIESIYAPLNTKNASRRLRSIIRKVVGKPACVNVVLEPSTDDVGNIECLSDFKQRPRTPCYVPVCGLGPCAFLVAFDAEEDEQNYIRVIGEDPKYLVFGLRHMSATSDDMDSRLVIEYTDQPNSLLSRESLIIELGFKVEVKYKGVESSEHVSLAYKVMPSLIRVMGEQVVWIAFDKDEVRFGKNRDFRNPLMTVALKREARDVDSVFRFINMQSSNMMGVELECHSRCPIWYLVSTSRLYEHYIVPQRLDKDNGWKFILTFFVRWSDDFPNSRKCTGQRIKGGVKLVFSESTFGISPSSQVIVTIHQGTAVSLSLVYAHASGVGSDKPVKRHGPNNDCSPPCWTEYTLSYRAERSRGYVGWTLGTPEKGTIAELVIRDYNDRSRAFLPTWYHASSLHSCQIPANVALNCTPPEDFHIKRVDGEWSEWTPWVCNARCDGGFGTRERHCNQPRPNFWGQLCEGDPFAMGVCNDFKCGTFSPDVRDKLAEELRTPESVRSLTRMMGSKIRLSCSSPATKLALDSEPTAQMVWYFNRAYLDMTRWKVLNGGDIFSDRLSTNDSGVYVCNVATPEPTRDELSAVVISLTVHSKEVTLYVHEKEHMEIACNIELLGLVYADLSQIWLKDGSVYQDLGVTLPSSTNLLSLRATSNLTGIWECQVQAESLNMTWKTAWHKVEVMPGRTWLSDFYKSIIYKKMTELHGKRLWITLAVLTFIMLLSCKICLCMAQRKMRKEAQEIKAYINAGVIDKHTLSSAGVSLSEILQESEDSFAEGGNFSEESYVVEMPSDSDASASDSELLMDKEDGEIHTDELNEPSIVNNTPDAVEQLENESDHDLNNEDESDMPELESRSSSEHNQAENDYEFDDASNSEIEQDVEQMSHEDINSQNENDSDHDDEEISDDLGSEDTNKSEDDDDNAENDETDETETKYGEELTDEVEDDTIVDEESGQSENERQNYADHSDHGDGGDQMGVNINTDEDSNESSSIVSLGSDEKDSETSIWDTDSTHMVA